MNFYNPYQFIYSDKISKHLTAFSAIGTEANPIRHDKWVKDHHSGRIICQLTTQTPTMLGGPHNRQQTPAKIENYRIPQNASGSLAIPANSLRGMITSTAETISHSAMRVLDNEHYSYRKPMSEALKALGELVQKENGQWTLQPLAIMSARIDQSGTLNFEPKWLKLFQNTALTEGLAGYLGQYNSNEKLIHKGRDISHWDSFNAKEPVFIYIKKQSALNEIKFNKAINIDSLTDCLHIKRIVNRRNTTTKTLAGRELFKNPLPLSQQEFDDLPDAEKSQYQRGLFYALGKEGRSGEMPNTKKHELFVPYHQSIEPIKVDKQIIDQFNRLSSQRAQTTKDKEPALQLPFMPKGKARPRENQPFIDSREIVYFDMNNQQQITEVSYSAIWRKKVQKTTHHFFSDAMGKNSLPWGEAMRCDLTPAEALFGVVSQTKKTPDTASKNLASRIRFYDALANKEIDLEGEQTLKVLGSPQAPSPAMYFHNQSGAGIAKTDLNQAIRPNGRKRYLHHRKEEVGQQIWQTKIPEDNIKQKVRCKPIKQQQNFYFHIDFNNLSDDELGLLLNAIEPNYYHQANQQQSNQQQSNKTRFWHKIGMGKSLGLGSVNVATLGIYLVDRQNRYSLEGVNNLNRYQQSACFAELNEKLQNRYPNEAQNNTQKTTHREQWKSQMVDKLAIEALLSIGCRDDMGDHPVSYPYKNIQAQLDTETGNGYEWFVGNDNTRNNRIPQNLGVVRNNKIPTLKDDVFDTTSPSYPRNDGNGIQNTTGNTKIFIGGVPVNSDAEIEDWSNDFKQAMRINFGIIQSLDVVKNKNKDVWFGFATFVDTQACTEALKQGYITVQNKRISFRTSKK